MVNNTLLVSPITMCTFLYKKKLIVINVLYDIYVVYVWIQRDEASINRPYGNIDSDQYINLSVKKKYVNRERERAKGKVKWKRGWGREREREIIETFTKNKI